MEKKSVQYGSERIDFDFLRRERKTLAISVYPDLRVEAIAPNDAPLEKVLEKVQRRSRWILRQQRQFLAWMPKPSPRNYQSGETHRYLGRQYQLKIISSPDNTTKLRGRYLEVRTQQENVEKLVKAWFREKAKIKLNKQLKISYQNLASYQLPEPTLRIRNMSKRWGSCTSKQEIILNPELIKTPSLCIEYVIIHELCHLRHRNHSKAFFKMLDAILPDWKKRKERLEKTEI